jgi:hypothetical protein
MSPLPSMCSGWDEGRDEEEEAGAQCCVRRPPGVGDQTSSGHQASPEPRAVFSRVVGRKQCFAYGLQRTHALCAWDWSTSWEAGGVSLGRAVQMPPWVLRGPNLLQAQAGPLM